MGSNWFSYGLLFSLVNAKWSFNFALVIRQKNSAQNLYCAGGGWWVGGGWCTFYRPQSGLELSIYPSYARTSLAPLGDMPTNNGPGGEGWVHSHWSSTSECIYGMTFCLDSEKLNTHNDWKSPYKQGIRKKPSMFVGLAWWFTNYTNLIRKPTFGLRQAWVFVPNTKKKTAKIFHTSTINMVGYSLSPP